MSAADWCPAILQPGSLGLWRQHTDSSSCHGLWPPNPVWLGLQGFVVSAFYLNKLFPFHRVQHWSKAGDFFLFLMRLGFCAFFPWFVLTSALLDLGFLFFAAHLLSTWNMVSCPAVEEQLENSLEKQQKWRLDCWTFHFFPSFPLAKLHVWVMLLTLDQEWMWRKHLSRSQRAWFAETRCWHNIRLHTKGPNLI